MIQTSGKVKLQWGLKGIVVERAAKKSKTGKCSYYYVSRVLNGEVPDQDVLDIIKKVQEEYKANKAKAAATLEEIKKEL